MEGVIQGGERVKGRVGRELWGSAFIFSNKLLKDILEIQKIGSLVKLETKLVPQFGTVHLAMSHSAYGKQLS